MSDWNERERFYLKLKISAFQNFMINTMTNNIINPIEQSMDYPVNEYFIYSSHNTYLKGHQLYGKFLINI